MFTKSARFYDAIYHFIDYKSASEKLHKIIQAHKAGASTLLDVACGTGKHIENLNKYYEAEGLDLSEDLLNIAKERCPGNVFYLDNMINFNLDKKYDVITCLFSSIAYVKTQEHLYQTIQNMSHHLKPGGIIIIEPWFSKKNFWSNIITANHYDSDDLKITWMYTSKIENELSILEINYLIGTTEKVIYFKERHELGLFDDFQYREALKDAGLKISYDNEGLFGRGMYIGIKI